MHVSLAEIFGAHPATTAERAAIGSAWRRRLGIAAHEVPAIAPLRDAIESVYLAADGARWPGLQRVHGDYHLGQVILVPGRGWVLLDFEGEPLRPMVERLRPDLAPRDVAGMLRSFDYVAGSIDADPQAADAWARDARDAFLAGYAAASETDLAALAPVLAALELDKAVYEAIYETRNRPSWASIPLAAVTRLVGD